ncbi:MAG TPA: biotin--[acetyl-CoA-carboxylase] ligase [Candidatus Acidoferrales bacterium]|nr:biotin--[acetyl-CoA-carboxylase] ligase [Candidatus Acidoferrales bacterium]
MRLLDLATLTSLVSALPRFGTFSHSISVESTNAVAVERLYTNDSFGISFVTETQTRGRGRAGRTWESPAGSGLYVSTILPAELAAGALPAVGFWASLSVREACLDLAGVALDPKWPNDLLWQGRKCVGILSQGRWNGEAARVVVGVGINVNRPEQVDAAIAESAIWLSEASDREIDRTQLLARLLAIYERDFDRLLAEPEKVIADWGRVAQLDGTQVAVKATDGHLLHAGVVTGLARDGALLLQTERGVVRVSLGDVEALPA